MAIQTFECGACHYTVTEEHDEDIAISQAKRDFPDHLQKGKLVKVCKSCYDRIVEMIGQKQTLQ